MKEKVINPVPVQWILSGKEEPDGLIPLKPINVVNGYMQVPRVDFTESFLSITSDISTRILNGLNVYQEEEGWVSDICDVEVAFLHPDMQVEMFIE